MLTLVCDGCFMGIIEAPPGLNGLTNYSREALETNQPILRRETTVHDGFYLSVFPIYGKRNRVVAVLEPQVPSHPR